MIDYFDSIYTQINDANKTLAKFKYYSIQRSFIRLISNLIIPCYYLSAKKASAFIAPDMCTNRKKNIISLTSFPARINRIWIVIESLFRQTQKPDKIILWLSRDQFKSIDILPRKLIEQRDRGLEIKLVEGDIKSHKKYFFCLKEYTDDILVTVDDDIIYPTFLLSKLLEYRRIYPQSIICNRALQITSEMGQVRPYTQWVSVRRKNEPSFKIFFTSGGGTLFPPYALHKEVLNEEAIKEKSLLADDIWLNCMGRLNNTTVVKTDYYSICLPLLFLKNRQLKQINLNQRGNDIQLDTVRKHCLDKYGTDPFKKAL